jgi:hypothetical protein
MQIIKKLWWILVNPSWEVLIFREKLEWEKEWYNIVKWTYDDKIDKTLWLWLIREIYEETNLKDIKIQDVFNIYPKYYENHISLLIVFIIKVNDFSEISNKNIKWDENIWEYRWLNKEDFTKLKLDDFFDERIYKTLKDYFNIFLWKL